MFWLKWQRLTHYRDDHPRLCGYDGLGGGGGLRPALVFSHQAQKIWENFMWRTGEELCGDWPYPVVLSMDLSSVPNWPYFDQARVQQSTQQWPGLMADEAWGSYDQWLRLPESRWRCHVPSSLEAFIWLLLLGAGVSVMVSSFTLNILNSKFSRPLESFKGQYLLSIYKVINFACF